MEKAPRRRRRPAGEPELPPVENWAGSARTIPELRAASADCRACPIGFIGTQTVFGEGPEDARMVLVGEQPGNEEDLAGRPFVGPAGRVLARAMDEAGVPRAGVYVTNAVKHFKHEMRGKKRLHSKPRPWEVEVCGEWLARELDAIQPELIVALGATAARALLGRGATIGKMRGAVQQGPRGPVVVTYHPSAVLRGEEAAAEIYAAIVEDLRLAWGLVSG